MIAGGRSQEADWDQLWLPLWPLASDDFRAGVYRMARGDALQRRYVEANPQALSNLLVVDIDQPDAALRALASQGSHPLPTAIVENRTNGHAHAVWALAEPVTRTEYGSRKAVAYAASVVEGLRRAVDGDAGYSGLLTKNPVHDAWDTTWLGDDLRSLRQLEEDLGRHMPPQRWRRSREPVGLGRNCTIFETARTWAYREARRIRLRNEHPTAADSRDLHVAVLAEVAALNAEFSEPLPFSEIHALAASIHRWITTKFYGWTNSRTVNEATFTTIQAARSRKAATDRAEARDILVEAILAEQEQGERQAP